MGFPKWARSGALRSGFENRVESQLRLNGLHPQAGNSALSLDERLLTAQEVADLRKLTTFEIQIWLNKLAEEDDYSESVVRSCFNNIRAITHLARKQKFLVDDPGEDVTMPITKVAKKPATTLEQSLSLLAAITDLHDLCLMLIGIFSGPRASASVTRTTRSVRSSIK